MEVSSTEIQNNFGLYLKFAQHEDVYVTRNGKVVAILSGYAGLRFSEGAKSYGENKAKLTLDEFLDFASQSSERYEFIDGEVICLAAPSLQHQNCVLELAAAFRDWASPKTCRAVVAPFDVLLQVNDAVNVVQPDVLIICDQENVDEQGRYRGIPVLVAEVLSEGNRSHDLIRKLDVYSRAGIKEYWIVNPSRREILVYIFSDFEVQDYRVYAENTRISSAACLGLTIAVQAVFQ